LPDLRNRDTIPFKSLVRFNLGQSGKGRRPL
jgi:hypothetical protein